MTHMLSNSWVDYLKKIKEHWTIDTKIMNTIILASKLQLSEQYYYCWIYCSKTNHSFIFQAYIIVVQIELSNWDYCHTNDCGTIFDGITWVICMQSAQALLQAKCINQTLSLNKSMQMQCERN